MTKKKDNMEETVQQPQPAEEAHEECCQDADPAEEVSGVEQTEDKAAEYYQQILRLQADFENYRKRTEREKPLFIEYGKTEVLKNILPLYDTLLKARQEVGKEDADIKHVKQGLKMIFEEFDKLFKSEGLKIVSAKGKPYDPMTQEVITTIPCEEKDDGIVMEELSQGVMLGDKVIRAAQVIVGKKKEDVK